MHTFCKQHNQRFAAFLFILQSHPVLFRLSSKRTYSETFNSFGIIDLDLDLELFAFSHALTYLLAGADTVDAG